MLRTIVHGRLRRLLAIAALASYGSAGVLGYGLHSLWHCEHDAETAAADHCGCCGHDCHAPAPVAACETPECTDGPSLAAACDDCSICSFLAQAQTSAVDAPAVAGSAPVAPSPALGESLVLAAALAAPSARGPPQA